MHQPLVYAFGVLTTCLRVRCTNHLLIKHWLIRGEAHEYIDHVVCFNIKNSHHPNKHTILHVFRACGYDSIVPLNWYKQELKLNIIYFIAFKKLIPNKVTFINTTLANKTFSHLLILEDITKLILTTNPFTYILNIFSS